MGEFLRVHVELNISNPLIRAILLAARVGEKAKWYKVKDAKIPHYCFSCGRIGHGDKECEDTPESDGKNQYGEWLRASSDRQGFRNDVKVPARSSNFSKSGSFVSSSLNKNSQAGTEDSSEDPGMEATSPLRMPSNYERECNSKQSLMNAYDVEMSTVGNGKEEGSHMDVHQAEKQYKLVNVNVPDLLQQPTKGNVQSADTYEEFETSHVVDMQKQMVTMEGGACDKKASKWRRAKPKEAGNKENAGVVCGKRKKFLLKGVLSQQANDNSEELWETEGGEGGCVFRKRARGIDCPTVDISAEAVVQSTGRHDWLKLELHGLGATTAVGELRDLIKSCIPK